MKKGWKWLILLLVLSCLMAGCSDEEAVTEQKVTCENLTITLPARFQDFQINGIAGECKFYYGFGGAEVFAYKDTYELLAEYDIEADPVALLGRLAENSNASIVDGKTIYYEAVVDDGTVFGYYVRAYADSDGIWTVYACCPADTIDTMSGELLGYLDSVVIAE